ncbi:MAG: class I SAM-dependent rRNA methyltransferase, partial [Cyanobacteria bacterium NC_groundwater_1444_Ag_S-0.65um_54_12]|nr:class I SAM-dependent rRNA methyltransferase [Cyanobacteria bacterium NC_groundwater_1444_Ag_S-0.65um_54_12]
MISPKVTLRRGHEARLRAGHPWVFAGDLAETPPLEDTGNIVEVLDSRGRFLGMAMYNPRCNLTLRVLTRQREDIDRRWLARRLTEALALRSNYLPGLEALRLVNAESDGLPAFIVDRYGEYLVVQSLALGADWLLPDLVAELVEQLDPEGIYERSDVPVRALEGLSERKGVLWGESPPDRIIISEGSYRFHVDLLTGQKTGFFLDQRPNRQRLLTLAKGKRVLNTFCYSGGFSIAAACGGSAETIGIDLSASALELARDNAALNGVADKCHWIADNAFDLLRAFDRGREKFDIVVLDPPSFTKTKESLPGACRGYKEINLRAIKLLSPGGILVSSSCSHHMNQELF